MTTSIQLDADISDLFEEANTPVAVTVAVTATKIYLEDAFKCKVSSWHDFNHVHYLLHDIDPKQAEAIMELLGMFTMFNATCPIAQPKE